MTNHIAILAIGAALTVLSAQAQPPSKAEKVQISKELATTAADLERDVCADAAYTEDCSRLRFIQEHAGELTGEEQHKRQKKIQDDNDAFENRVAADAKYKARYQKVQDLQSQLGIPTHTDSQGKKHFGAKVQ